MAESRARRVAYVGPMAFPDGGAAARRILGNAQSLRDAGWEVLIGSGQMPVSAQSFPFQGFEVHSIGERDSEHLPTIVKHMKYLRMGRKTVRWLDLLNPKPDAVILYSGFAAYFTQLIPWCRRNGIPLVFDSVEWYEASDMPGGALGPYRWGFEYAMRKQSIQCGRIIAISRYLTNYFKANGCKTVRVPPTLDVEQLESRVDAVDGPLMIGYTGTPGKKDLLDPLIEAILRVDPDGERVRVVTAGFKPDVLLNQPALCSRGFTSLPNWIEVKGSVDHTTALSIIRDSDFSILLRRPLRYAQAGFATKVVESLSLGTPVICNLTGDLDLYVRNGENGFVSSDETVENLVPVLERALSLTTAERSAMRRVARCTAQESFDYRLYSQPLSDLLTAP